MNTPNRVVERLLEEAERLSGHSIDRGSVDAGIASNLASEAVAEIERLEALVVQAFRDGLSYATNVVVTDPDEAWRTSRVRAQLTEPKP